MLLRIRILLLSFCIFGIINAQVIKPDVNIDNKLNSPYSYYGLGDFQSEAFAPVKSMGGASIGLRNTNMINVTNPATYALKDTLSFILDFGFISEKVNIDAVEGNANTYNNNIDHIAISYSISKRWKGSAGLLPYCKTGYNILEVPSLPDSSDFNLRVGNGEINRFYFGNAIKINPSFSVGFNASYLFGKSDKEKRLEFPTLPSSTLNYYERAETILQGFLFDFGLQYEYKFNSFRSLAVGLIYQPKSKIYTELYNSSHTENPIGTTTYLSADTSDTHSTLPAKFGIGLSYRFNDKLLVAGDFKYQNWDKAIIEGEKDQTLTKSYMFNLGAQYIPFNKTSRSFFNKMHYRIGGYYYKTPIYINNAEIKDFAITAGLGLPFKSNTILNVSTEIGHRGSNSDDLIKEKYIKLNFNISFYDIWFYRPKFD